jgi:tetratricopeptide (TPR) repeat protein
VPQARLPLWLLLPLALLGRAGAEEAHDAEIARHYFEAGRSAYQRGRYDEAVEAFQAAARLTPRPALEYDLGLAFEQLGRDAEAVAAYRRFLTQAPDSPEAVDVRGRLDALTGRAHRLAQRRALRDAAIGVGVLSVAAAITGAGLLGSAAADYASLRDGCGVAGLCPRDSWAGVEARDIASRAVFAIAGTALVVDVALWVAWARRPRPVPMGSPL